MVVDSAIRREANAPWAERSGGRAFELRQHFLSRSPRDIHAQVEWRPLEQRIPFLNANQRRQLRPDPLWNYIAGRGHFSHVDRLRAARLAEHLGKSGLVLDKAEHRRTPALRPLGRPADRTEHQFAYGPAILRPGV